MRKTVTGSFCGDKERFEIPDDYIYVVTAFTAWRCKDHWSWKTVVDNRLIRNFARRFTLGRILMGGIQDHYRHVGSRTFGFFHDFSEAEEAVLSNSMDLCEARYYEFVVIEATSQGIHSEVLEVQWYKWVGAWDTGFFMKCGRPDQVVHVSRCKGVSEFFRNCCNFGLG